MLERLHVHPVATRFKQTVPHTGKTAQELLIGSRFRVREKAHNSKDLTGTLQQRFERQIRLASTNLDNNIIMIRRDRNTSNVSYVLKGSTTKPTR